MSAPVVSVPYEAVAPIGVVAYTALVTDVDAASSVRVAEFDQTNLYVDFTIGSLTSLLIRVEYSDDDSDWHQIASSSIAGAFNDIAVYDFRLTASDKYKIELPTADAYIKVSLLGVGDPANSAFAGSLQLK